MLELQGAQEQLLGQDAQALREALAHGTLSSRALAEACLTRIARLDPQIRAFAWIDPDYVRAQADRLDNLHKSGAPLGPLHGLPIALKDVIDTADMPTENGTPLDQGRRPTQDAAIVARLRDAGALIIGKTVTTELAFLHPGPTCNPTNVHHTPGGSSQGSAAAVAAQMVPLAIGTQTGGSVTRPAAYCGVVGLKPSFAALPRRGVLLQSHSLDTLGIFAQTLGGVALVYDAVVEGKLGRLTGALTPAPTVRGAQQFGILATLPGTTPGEPAPQHPDVRAMMANVAARLGAEAIAMDLPEVFDHAALMRECINDVEMAACYAPYQAAETDTHRLSPEMHAALTRAAGRTTASYHAARAFQHDLISALEPLFARADVLVCPATPTPAPKGLGSTGSSIFNGLWTLCGTPTLTLPLYQTQDGLPLGLQLVARPGAEAILLRRAATIWQKLQ